MVSLLALCRASKHAASGPNLTMRTDYAVMVREICAHMTREKAAEALGVSKGCIDLWLSKTPPKRPYAPLADAIRMLHSTYTSGNAAHVDAPELAK